TGEEANIWLIGVGVVLLGSVYALVQYKKRKKHMNK
ncbi:LPXTG cell wall anchor domain-containing protein, partial [Enterococcus faecalis]